MKKVIKTMHAYMNVGLLLAACVVSTGLFGAMGAPAPAPVITPADDQVYKSIEFVMRSNKLDDVKKYIQFLGLKVTDKYGYPQDTLLQMAVSAGNLDAVNYLIEQKSDVNAVNNNGQSVLMLALRYSPTLSDGPRSPEEAEKYYAIQEFRNDQQEEILEQLIAQNLLPKQKGKASSFSQGSFAEDIMGRIEDFIGAGDDEEFEEKTAAAMVRTLLNAGADARAVIPVPNTVPPRTETVLHIAVQMNNAEAVKLLLNAGADANSATLPDNVTPLMEGHGGSKELYSELLDHGADINARDAKGRTALIHAAMHQCEHGVIDTRSLLEAGADVDVRDNFGKTALDYATRRPDVAALLNKFASYSRETKAHEQWLKEHKEYAEKPLPSSVSDKQAKERKSRHEYGESSSESEGSRPSSPSSEMSQGSEASGVESKEASDWGSSVMDELD